MVATCSRSKWTDLPFFIIAPYTKLSESTSDSSIVSASSALQKLFLMLHVHECACCFCVSGSSEVR